jgi:hypothetical protein
MGDRGSIVFSVCDGAGQKAGSRTSQDECDLLLL